ncbi:hypothetical protein AB205_0102480, partial [Aquarana catesbeiana]
EDNSNDGRDTEENSNDGSQQSKRRRTASGESSPSCENSNQDFGSSYFPAENLVEYKWPSDETGEYYMLQEQVSEYLGVTSFKRKYPGNQLCSHARKVMFEPLVPLTTALKSCNFRAACLTALRSDEVIDLMMKEYPTKHAEYSVILQEKERQRITDHYKEYSVIQVPQGKYKILPTEITKVSPYPVSLIPGQFQEYYKRYSPNELRYLPLNTALYEPPLDPLDPELLAFDSDGDSDEVEEGRSEKKKIKGSSGSSSGNLSDGENAQDTQDDTLPAKPKAKEKPTPKKESTKRSVGSKSSSGYKVEDKSP